MKPYNLSILEELDDKQQLLTIVDLFLTNTPLQIKDLLAAARDKDWEKVYGHAHKLKGGAGIFQANELVDLLKQIEVQVNSPKDDDIINGLLQSLDPAFAKIEVLLKEERNK